MLRECSLVALSAISGHLDKDPPRSTPAAANGAQTTGGKKAKGRGAMASGAVPVQVATQEALGAMISAARLMVKDLYRSSETGPNDTKKHKRHWDKGVKKSSDENRGGGLSGDNDDGGRNNCFDDDDDDDDFEEKRPKALTEVQAERSSDDVADALRHFKLERAKGQAHKRKPGF